MTLKNYSLHPSRSSPSGAHFRYTGLVPHRRSGERVLLVLASIVATVTTTSTVHAQRLPTLVQPEHYQLSFDIDLQDGTFSGTEDIRVAVVEPTARIALHALDLAIQDATVETPSGPQATVVSLEPRVQQIVLTVPRLLERGTAHLRIRFTGRLGDQLRGLYLSKAHGRRYAVSQFESSDARRAFPSFDEPTFKATFDIAATIDKGDVAISNGRVIADDAIPNTTRHTVRFATTARMFSYLVALTVGDYVCTETLADAVPLRVCTASAKQTLAGTATEIAGRSLAFYQQYFRVRYPFGKLDIVAVPEFAAAAMENTGAIFAREASILVDPNTASLTTRKSVAAVVAHEIAHQ